MGIGLFMDREGWWRTAIGDEGAPHGVSGLMLATWVKSASEARPVPPITAMRMGSERS